MNFRGRVSIIDLNTRNQISLRKDLMNIKPDDDAKALDAMYAEALRCFQAGDLDGVLSHWDEGGLIYGLRFPQQ
jgi:hypothetical protein